MHGTWQPYTILFAEFYHSKVSLYMNEKGVPRKFYFKDIKTNDSRLVYVSKK